MSPNDFSWNSFKLVSIQLRKKKILLQISLKLWHFLLACNPTDFFFLNYLSSLVFTFRAEEHIFFFFFFLRPRFLLGPVQLITDSTMINNTSWNPQRKLILVNYKQLPCTQTQTNYDVSSLSVKYSGCVPSSVSHMPHTDICITYILSCITSMDHQEVNNYNEFSTACHTAGRRNTHPRMVMRRADIVIPQENKDDRECFLTKENAVDDIPSPNVPLPANL